MGLVKMTDEVVIGMRDAFVRGKGGAEAGNGKGKKKRKKGRNNMSLQSAQKHARR